MSPAKRRAIAALGGAAVPAARRGFSNRKVARRAGKLGGKQVHKKERDRAQANQAD
jgi:hypothetical protein